MSSANKPPLTGQISLRPDFGRWISEQDIENAQAFLSHDGSYTGEVLHAAGRNVTIPGVHMQSPYDSIQISGGAYISLGVESNSDNKGGIIEFYPEELEIEPPAPAAKRYTHNYSVYKDGAIVSCQDVSPMGSYTEAIADRKIQNTASAATIETTAFFPPIVLGKFVFDNLPDGDGGNATAILLGVPERGERADTGILMPLLNIDSYPETVRSTVFSQALNGMIDTCFLTGVAAADIHRAGKVHGQMTLGNVLGLLLENGDKTLYVADWETVYEPSEEDMRLAAMMDVKSSVVSISQSLDKLSQRHIISRKTAVSILSYGLANFLTGYTGIDVDVIGDYQISRNDDWIDAIVMLANPSVDKQMLEDISTFVSAVSG